MSQTPIPRIAGYTWSRQWPGVALIGAAFGVLSFAPFALKRSLGADEKVIPLLIALFQVVWIFTPAAGPLLARANPQRLWRWIALATYGPILLVAFVAVEPLGDAGRGTGNVVLFLVAMGLHHFALVAYVPHRGALIRTNYPREVRGRMYGFIQFITFLMMMGAARVVAMLLDRDPRWLRVVFPVAAIAGGIGVWLHARIRWRGQKKRHDTPRIPSWHQVWRVLKEDKAFRTYEIGFMLYGFGFLMSWPLHILFAEQELGLSYGEYSWAQMFAFPLAQIAATRFWGRLSDRIGVVRTTALAVLTLGAFLAGMGFVTDVYGLIAAFALFGVAMAGIDVGWSLGPLAFAKDRQAHMYMAIHFALVGVRSIFAPFLGYWIMHVFSFRAGYFAATALMVAALATIWRLSRRNS